MGRRRAKDLEKFFQVIAWVAVVERREAILWKTRVRVVTHREPRVLASAAIEDTHPILLRGHVLVEIVHALHHLFGRFSVPADDVQRGQAGLVTLQTKREARHVPCHHCYGQRRDRV